MKRKKVLQIQIDLDVLYQETTFKQEDGLLSWGGIKIELADDRPNGVDIYVPQCSYFGGTMINLGDGYERSGADCLFIQELVRLYREGKLKVEVDKTT